MIHTNPLPELLDCKGLQRELNISRAAAERIMRHVPKVQIPGLRKVYVRRADVEARMDEWYSRSDSVNGRAPRKRPRPGTEGVSFDAVSR